MSTYLRSSHKWRTSAPIEYTGRNLSYGVGTTSDYRGYKLRRSLEAVLSEGHPYHMLGKTALDLGGPFDLQRQTVSGRLEPRWLRSLGLNNQFANEYYTIVVPSGAVTSAINGMAGPTTAEEATSRLIPMIPNRPSETTMDGVGAKFINILNPTNPIADTATTIAEFMSERKLFSLPSKSSSVEGEYLNAAFGISPFLGYLEDFHKAARTQEKHLDQLRKDSGKRVRRNAEWLPTTSVTKTVANALPAGLGQGISTSVARVGKLTTITRQYQKYWFSGSFTYHLPKEGFGRKLAELDSLYGVNPGAQSIGWELMPFSWLIDYKVSLGDSVGNLDKFAQYHIVMPYAYVMCHTKSETEYTWEGELRGPDGNWSFETLSNTVKTESKQRRAANPFGFGLSDQSLNNDQLSILAALGITLVRRK